MSDEVEQPDVRYASRKWILAKWILATSTAITVAVVTTRLLGIGPESPSTLDVLNWWSYTAGAVLTLYGGANVLEKKIQGGAK